MDPEARGFSAYRRPSPIGRGLAFVRATGVAFVVTVIVALVSLIRERGYGAADLPVFLFVSLVFACFVGLLAGNPSDVTTGARAVWRLVVMLVFGALVGIVGTLAAALFFGPGIGAVSLPILIAWVLAGSLGLAVGRHRFSISLARELSAVGAVALLLAVIAEPLLLWARGSQELELFWLIRSDTSSDLRLVEERGTLALEDAGEALLREAGIVGELRVKAWSRQGKGSRAVMYVVLDRPVTERHVLRQPDGGAIVYVQEEHGFRSYPANADLSEKVVEIVPGDEEGFDYWVQMAGRRSGRHLSYPALAEEPGERRER
jgi:hypothetical protein